MAVPRIFRNVQPLAHAGIMPLVVGHRPAITPGSKIAPARTGNPWVISWDGLSAVCPVAPAAGNALARINSDATTSGIGRYFEVTVWAVGSGSMDVGLSYSDQGKDDFVHNDGGAYISDGRLSYLGTTVSTGTAFSGPIVIGIFLDETNHFYARRVGNAWEGGANADARSGGIDVSSFFPAFTFAPAVSTNGAGTSVTFNIGATPFAGQIPASGVSWDGTQVPAAQSAAVGPASETDSSLTLAAAMGLGLGAETDTALALAGKQIASVGLSAETDTSLALSPVGIRAVGLSSEADIALVLGRATPNGLCTETDAALALAGAVVAPVGACIETDATFAPGRASACGLSSESDAGLALARTGISATGLAIEIDASLVRSGIVLRTTGLCGETDASLPLAGLDVRPAGVSSETDAAIALSGIALQAAGRSDETDLGLALTSGGQSGSIGIAAESDGALALGAARPCGVCVESNIGLALGVANGLVPANENDAAVALQPVQARPVLAANDNETAFALPMLFVAQAGLALETDMSLALSHPIVTHGSMIRFTRERLPFPRAAREDRRRKF